jgi:hypothetical protein
MTAKNVSPLGRRAETAAENAARRAKHERQWRELENGAVLTVAEGRAEETVKEARRAWRAAPTVEAPRADCRRAEWGQVLRDLRAVVRTVSRGFTRDERETLATDAAVLIYRWPEHGAEHFPLGGAEDAPLLRDWRELDETGRATGRLTEGAFRAARAAVKQAAQSPTVADRPVEEVPTEAVALGVLAEEDAEQCRADENLYAPLPSRDAPTILGELLDLPEAACRVLVADAWRLTPDDCAELWGVARASVAPILTRGRKQVRHAYPDPAELLADLAEAAPRYRAQVQARAVVALSEYRDGWCTADEARDAVAAWRETGARMADHARALEAAAQGAVRRSTGRWAPDRAALLAQTIRRLVGAEENRARRIAQVAKLGAAPLRGTVLMAEAPSFTRRSLPYRELTPDQRHEAAATLRTIRHERARRRVAAAPRPLPTPGTPLDLSGARTL